jgi:low temperature requirement protein LtrA
VFGVSGFRVSAGHFAERFSLIVIIALGESIVAIGTGVHGELDTKVLTAVALGLVVACALWWAYFDVVAVVAERRFRRMPAELRVRIARDSYSYLHLPMIAGIVLVSLGVKKTLAHVDEPLDTVPAVALFGGIALYYAGHVGFRLRNLGTLNRIRLGALLTSLALILAGREVDALVALALAAGLTSGVIAYEAFHFREARYRIRHEQGSM